MTSGVYKVRKLNFNQWQKVLSWAMRMDGMARLQVSAIPYLQCCSAEFLLCSP